MASSFNRLALTLALIASGIARAEVDPEAITKARFLSFAVRDLPLSADEARKIHSGELTPATALGSWLDSDAHGERLHRYFNDMFGVREWSTLMEDTFQLEKSETTNAYFLEDIGECAAGQAVWAPAWWLEGNGQALFCPSVLSESIMVTVDGDQSWCTSPWNRSPGCACGPNRVLCFPSDLEPQLREEMLHEHASHAVAVYKRGGSWHDLYAEPVVYGSRLLYWYYLFQGKIRSNTSTVNVVTQSDLSALAAIPLTVGAQPLPDGPQRAGLVTSPGFLKQYNNFRSRFRALTTRLLCQDVDANLNTDNIAVFVNPDFDPNDLAHGHKPGCEGCHYPMDNAGSTLFDWDANGDMQQDWTRSTVGHIFGQGGTGPKFLIESFIERHPSFLPCMAQRAWEDLSGKPWTALSQEDKDAFKREAQNGPRALFRTIVTSRALEAVPGGAP